MEKVLQDMGQCGRFQVCHVTLVQACRYTLAWSFSFMMFGLYNPGWHCVPKDSTTKTLRIDGSANDSRWSPDVFEHNDESSPTTSSMDNLNASEFFNGSCDIIDSCAAIEFNPDSLTIVTEFGLICDRVWIGYTILSMLNVGMLTGAFVWGQVGERFGRRLCLYASTLTMGVASGLSVLSPSWQVYAMFTFFSGLGGVGVMPTVSVISMEFLSSKWRAKMASVPIWNLGQLSFAFVCYVLRDWRQIHLACAVLSGICCLGFFWTPESFRWLVIHGKTSRAKQVLDKISKLNGTPVPTDETLQQIMVSDDNEEEQKHYTYLDLFRNRAVRFTVLKLGLLRIVSVVPYDIIGFGIQTLPGNFYTNFFISSVTDFPMNVALGVLANALGRRPTGALYLLVGALCCGIILVSLGVMDDNGGRGILVTSLAIITRAATGGLVSWLIIVGTELLPTAVRNLSFGYLNILSRVSAMVGVYLIPRDFSSMIACFAVLLLIQVGATVVVFSLPETRDKLMPDTIGQIQPRGEMMKLTSGHRH